MVVTPSVLVEALYGSAQSVTIRRHRNTLVLQQGPRNAPPHRPDITLTLPPAVLALYAPQPFVSFGDTPVAIEVSTASGTFSLDSATPIVNITGTPTPIAVHITPAAITIFAATPTPN